MKKFFLFFLCFILMGGIVIFPSKRDIYDTDVNNREVVIKTDSETAETETTETEITETEIAETEIAETEIAETEITEPVISNKPETFLLIGSSYFYYNNVPEMVYNFAKEGTGRDIEMAACSLNGQTILEHARAIKAVIRTEGDLKKLTAAEKNILWQLRLLGRLPMTIMSMNDMPTFFGIMSIIVRKSILI